MLPVDVAKTAGYSIIKSALCTYSPSPAFFFFFLIKNEQNYMACMFITVDDILSGVAGARDSGLPMVHPFFSISSFSGRGFNSFNCQRVVSQIRWGSLLIQAQSWLAQDVSTLYLLTIRSCFKH